ncbi:hypothetical protein FI667_g4840, partial [Globisporangium splendens]
MAQSSPFSFGERGLKQWLSGSHRTLLDMCSIAHVIVCVGGSPSQRAGWSTCSWTSSSVHMRSASWPRKATRMHVRTARESAEQAALRFVILPLSLAALILAVVICH